MDFKLHNISPSTQGFMVSKQHPLRKSKGQKTSQFGDIKIGRLSIISSQWNVMVYFLFKENVLFFLLEHGLVTPMETLGINNSEKIFSSLLSLAHLILWAFVFHSSKLNLSHSEWWLASCLLELLDPLGTSSRYPGTAPPTPARLLPNKALWFLYIPGVLLFLYPLPIPSLTFPPSFLQ